MKWELEFFLGKANGLASTFAISKAVTWEVGGARCQESWLVAQVCLHFTFLSFCSWSPRLAIRAGYPRDAWNTRNGWVPNTAALDPGDTEQR